MNWSFRHVLGHYGTQRHRPDQIHIGGHRLRQCDVSRHVVGEAVQRRRPDALLRAEFIVERSTGYHPELPGVGTCDVGVGSRQRRVQTEHVHARSPNSATP